MGLNSKPSAEQLRNMDARSLREQFEFGLEEAKRLKVEQRIRDNIADLINERERRILLDLLWLITGRTD
jgi:hypothetical protein